MAALAWAGTGLPAGIERASHVPPRQGEARPPADAGRRSRGGRTLPSSAAIMGRMHSRGKGISASALPYKRTPPSWLKISSQDVEENICKFAKKGLTPSQIGVILRDSHGIAQVKSVTGSKILRILKAHGLAPEIPEDLYHLIKKQFPFGSIWRGTERTKIPSLDSSWLRAGSTVLLVTIRRPRSYHLFGNTNLQRRALLWRKHLMAVSRGPRILHFFIPPAIIIIVPISRIQNPRTSLQHRLLPKSVARRQADADRRSRGRATLPTSAAAAIMGRMHSRGKGISASALPYKRTPPSWLKISSQDVEENICKFAKKGLTPSQIGVILRDSHGIAQVKSVTGSKILRILKAHGLAPEIPEDLYHLIKKAVSIRKHLERNRKDKDSKFRLILVESRIHRLARYYKKTKKLPPVWKYESTTASTLVA
ncbi:hypothetical protein NL676_011815 [Syzygium grande]|nr:hypothetical protein NL676_011815 [Syzygium grande]